MAILGATQLVSDLGGLSALDDFFFSVGGDRFGASLALYQNHHSAFGHGVRLENGGRTVRDHPV